MSDQKTVKIPAQGAELESWLGLADISDLVPQGWSLAGGSMMRLLACERGYEGSRATRDIDVVLNIRARRRLIGEFVHALKSTGFVIDGYNASGQNHRWVRGLAQIDILVPSGQSEKTLSYDFSGLGKVLMTRGAQFGIDRTSSVAVECAGRTFLVNRPDALGALYEKCSALLNNGDTHKQRHLHDILVLVCLLSTSERRDLIGLSGKQRSRLAWGLRRALAEPGIGRPREREMAQDIVSFLDESFKN